MSWSYVATFTSGGTPWSIPHLPGAAVDAEGNLWVMWGGENKALTCFTQPLPTGGGVVPVSPTTIQNQFTAGSPCLMPVDGQVLVLWRGSADDTGDDQTIYCGQLPPRANEIDATPIPGAFTPDGPTATYIAGTDVVFAAWRGENDDTTFYYTNMTGPGESPPNPGSALGFGNPAFNSYYSPAVSVMPGGGIAACWKGVGQPATGGDDQLYFTTAGGNLDPGWAPVPGPLQYAVPGGGRTATALNRPSLALMTTQAADTLMLAYAGSMPGQLSYLTGIVGGGGVNWIAPLGGQPGTVPLGALLGTASPGGGAVTMTNPVCVWATAPATGDPLYLLVGDQPGGTITGPLYLLAYRG